jgi:hypothetical protein
MKTIKSFLLSLVRIIRFFLLSCIAVCCIDIIIICLSIDDTAVIVTRDFRFGFNLMLFVDCAIFSPIYTIFASILYYTKVNRDILTNIWYGILYCIIPSLCLRTIDLICNCADIKIGDKVAIFLYIAVLIVQNVIFILNKIIRHK